MSNPIRIATVKATGHRYLVISLDFTFDKALCWGELISYREKQRRHSDRRKYSLDEVTIETVSSVPVEALWQQAIASRRATGADIRFTRKGNAISNGTPLERAHATIFASACPFNAVAADFGGRRLPTRDERNDELLRLAEEAEAKGLSDQAEAILNLI